MEKTQFLKNTLLYFVGSSLSKVVSFILLPVYSQYLSPEDFGYFDLSQAYSYFIIPLLTCEVFVSLLRFIKGSNSNDENSKIVFSGIVVLGFVIGIGIILLFLSPLLKMIPYFNFIVISTILLTIQRFYLSACRGLNKNTVYVVSGILSSFSIAAINYVLLVWFNFGITSLYWSLILSILIQLLYIEIKIKVFSYIKLRYFNWELLKKLILFSIPLSVGSILYFLINLYNRIEIENKLGLESNGYFAVANKFSIILLFLTSAFTMAWQDFSFSGKNEKDTDKLSNGIDKYFTFITFGAILLIFIIHFVFPLIIDKQYHKAYLVTALNIGVTLFAALGDFLTQTFLAIKKSRFILISSIVGALVNFAIVGFAIDFYGVNGVNFALILIYFLNVLIRVYYLNTRISFKISYFKLVANFLFLLFAMVVFYSNKPLLVGISTVFAGSAFIYYFRIELIMLKSRIIKRKI